MFNALSTSLAVLDNAVAILLYAPEKKSDQVVPRPEKNADTALLAPGKAPEKTPPILLIAYVAASLVFCHRVAKNRLDLLETKAHA